MSIGAACMRTPRQLGGPASRGSAPAMTKDFHLPDDGITALDRFIARCAGVEPTPARTIRKADNDNSPTMENKDAA